MLTLADFVLDKFGGDSLAETRDNLARYRERICRRPTRRCRAARGDGRRARRAAPAARPDRRRSRSRLRRRRLRPGAWTSSSSGCPAAARAPSASGSPSVTAPSSSTSTSRSNARPADRSRDIFAIEGEAEFRALERAAVAGLGPPIRESRLRRVIATGGGAVIDPRNRWPLYRGRVPVWLDGRPEVLAQRLRRSRNVRPLIAGPRPDRRHPGARAARASGSMRRPIASTRVAEVAGVRRADRRARPLARAAPLDGTVLLRAETTIGQLVAGRGYRGRGAGRGAATRRGAAARSSSREPGAWARRRRGARAGPGRGGLRGRARRCCPPGEAAKTLAVVEAAARRLAGLRVERREPLVAVGGGALGDAAGFVAAVYLRGVP